MKAFLSMIALAFALGVTGPAFAGDVTKATDKASCDKAGGTWDGTAKACSEKKSNYQAPEPGFITRVQRPQFGEPRQCYSFMSRRT